MTVRPFWIKSLIDGRATSLQGGPRAKDGAMRTIFYQRQHGSPVIAIEINSFNNGEELRTEVIVKGEVVATIKTEY